jgi:phage recombination protein Bet
MAKALDNLLNTLAEKMGMGDDGAGLLTALKSTAFKPAKVDGQMVAPTDGQIMALLVVSNQYGLNPWLKEIYAYPDKRGGIIPVVGVDGWARIINTNPQYDGVDFEQDENCCTCTIYRKDRAHPTRITEYMVECRGNIGPWLSHPYRMLRHKALIQCARLAFGFGGIYEQDEADRIIDATDVTGEIAAPAKPRRASEALAAPTAPVILEQVLPSQGQPVPLEQVPEPAKTQAAAPVAQTATTAPVDTGEPASPGECMNILKVCKVKGIDVGMILTDRGIDLNPSTLAGLTKAQFKQLKGVL